MDVDIGNQTENDGDSNDTVHFAVPISTENVVHESPAGVCDQVASQNQVTVNPRAVETEQPNATDLVGARNRRTAAQKRSTVVRKQRTVAHSRKEKEKVIKASARLPPRIRPPRNVAGGISKKNSL